MGYWLASAVAVCAATIDDLVFVNHGTHVEITDCRVSANGRLTIPATFEGLKVSHIGASAFEECSQLTSITLPSNIAAIDSRAFAGCAELTGLIFKGDLPSLVADAFTGLPLNAVIHRMRILV